MADASARHLTIYVRLWAVANLLRIHVGYAASTALRGSQLDRYSVVLPLIIVLAALWPTRRAGQLTFVALALRAITNIAKGSHMSNSQLWATQHDLALLLALAAAALRKGSLETLTAADEREIIAECAPTIRLQMAILLCQRLLEAHTLSALGLLVRLALPHEPARIPAGPHPLTETLSHVAQQSHGRAIRHDRGRTRAAAPPRLRRRQSWPLSARLPSTWQSGSRRHPRMWRATALTCTRLFFSRRHGRRRRRAGVVPVARRHRGGGGGGGAVVVRPLHAEAVSMVQGNATDYHLAWLAILCVLYCRASTHRPRVIDLKTTGTRRLVTVQVTRTRWPM